MTQKRGSRRSAARRGKAPPASPKRGLGLWIKRFFVWGSILALLVVIFVGCTALFVSRSLPGYDELKTTQHAQTIVVRARDGSEIAEIGPSYGQWLSSDEIPQVMKDAMISVEDRRYAYHFGVDPIGLSRAVYVWGTGDSRLKATSTITQQLARNLFLSSNRTVDRKAREMIYAMALEMKFSKEEILELYLNKVYFGGGAYGIDSASRRFFSHPGTQLSTEEAAIIAGLVKAPSRFSPTADVDAAVDRAQVVLRLMKEQGRIPLDASVDPSAVQLKEDVSYNSVRYFTDWALPQLDILLAEQSYEPIVVWTTLDVGMQRAAESAIRTNTPSGAQGALVSLDRDGATLALVGGKDYVKSNFNRATDAMRQPGSSWKLFVYLSALEAGYDPDSVVVDQPVVINDWRPRNSGGNYAGRMTMRNAFAYSKNTVAAQLGNEVGFGTVASMARRFGITTPISTYPAMVLGSSETRLIDMTRAYAGVAAEGHSVEPYGIVKVTSASGEVLYRHQKKRSAKLVADYVAAGMTDMLETVVINGTGGAAQIDRPVAGKTGTTSSNKDGYFVGFSSGITTGVWMGRDDNRAVSGLQGGRAPARAFASFMRYAVRDRPVEPLKTEMLLPGWRLEQKEDPFADPDEEYFYLDENGNLVQPNGGPPLDGGLGGGGYQDGDLLNEPSGNGDPSSGGDAPPAASDNFLERATGGRNGSGRGRQNPQQPAPDERAPGQQDGVQRRFTDPTG